MSEIEIEEIKLDITLPDDGIGMVVMHPFVEIDVSREPYRWSNDKKAEEIKRIVRTLEIAKQADHSCKKTHFTIFPEYSIPGLEGIHKIQEILENDSWSHGTVVIGGVDGLTKSEYSTLCRENNTEVHKVNKPEEVRDGQWINCYILWEKTTNGKGINVVKRWVQPKICPSGQEEKIKVYDMFEGKCIYIFEGHIIDKTIFRFMSMICYDWIASLGDSNGILAILKKINQLSEAGPDGKPLHLCFVLQHNPKPNNPSFLSNAYDFFCRRDYPYVRRDKGVVALINSAGTFTPGPCEEYGYSTLIFSPNATYDSKGLPPSYAISTKILRGNEILQTCKETLFRENGGCIHSFRLFHPLLIDRTPENRRRPLGPVLVYALDENIKDPRTPKGQVSAVVKWINDKIDLIPDFSSANKEQLQKPIKDSQYKVTEEIRWCDHSFLLKMMLSATADMTKEEQENIDRWSEKEKRSLETIIHSLTLINCAISVTIRNVPMHASIKRNNTVIDIIIVSGGLLHEENIKHAINYCTGRKDGVILIISRNQFDDPLISTDRDKPIYEVETNIKWCGYYNLRECLTSSTPEELNEKIMGSMRI